jgi:hypothetical protein
MDPYQTNASQTNLYQPGSELCKTNRLSYQNGVSSTIDGKVNFFYQQQDHDLDWLASGTPDDRGGESTKE